MFCISSKQHSRQITGKLYLQSTTFIAEIKICIIYLLY